MISSTSQLLQTCRKLVCVGRNYAAHAKELGNAVPTKPVLFIKPSTSLVGPNGGSILCPDEVTDLHHEIEIGIVIGRTATDIAPSAVASVVAGYVLGLDMTARNVQDEAKKGALPWSVAKGYDTFAPISNFVPVSDFSTDIAAVNPSTPLELWCAVDGAVKQRGQTDAMIFNVATLIAHISRIFTLEPGDIVLTGTPDGVGPVKVGQTITAGITGTQLFDLSINVQRRTRKE